MTQPLSHRFITALSPHRDHLYTLALAAVSASPSAADLSPSALHARAEVLLHSAFRETFALFAQDPALDIAAALEKFLNPELSTLNPSPAPMPADIWARLVAAIQVEAASSEHSRALNPDSVLLTPDPLLAPKKTIPGDPDGFDLPPTSRFLLAGIIVILLAVAFTIYLLTRPLNPTTTRPASSAHTTTSK